MLRRRIKSALYIDFENVPLPHDAIANWLAWLEDGAFDPGARRRRFLQKRVYWNSHAEKNRGEFQRHGFVPILVGKFSGLKNGADIRMAMDVVEATYRRSEIEEFILLTGDSDFVPVLDRLREKAKRSAIVATEHRPNIHTTYQLHADIIIPSRRLVEAAQYRRPRRSLLGKLWPVRRAGKEAPAETQGAPTPKAERPSPDRRPVAPPTAKPELATAFEPAIEAALSRVATLLLRQPGNYVAQKRVLAELDRVPGFKRKGADAYLGRDSYKALMKELASLDARIKVIDQPGGGTGVVHVPPAPPAVANPPRAEAAVPGLPASGVAAATPKRVEPPSGEGQKPVAPTVVALTLKPRLCKDPERPTAPQPAVPGQAAPDVAAPPSALDAGPALAPPEPALEKSSSR